ncbi:MAG TPA: hypothetical protein VFV33_11725 [Gemmatimonadaceae bacterium]|nr:hypothetical protein [Gemmatimonadaceae bacterium]
MRDAYARALFHYALVGFVIGLPIAAVADHFLPIGGAGLPRFLGVVVLVMGVTVVAQRPAIARRAGWLAARDDARSRAVAAPGTVLRVAQTGASKQGALYLTVTLDVPLAGERRTVVAEGWRIDAADAPRVQPGQVIPVKIDPASPPFVFPDCDWIRETDDS